MLIDASSGERVPHWVDLDEYVVQAKIRVDADADSPDFTIDRSLDELQQERTLMIRPAIRLEDSTRYIVGNPWGRRRLQRRDRPVGWVSRAQRTTRPPTTP